MSPILGSRAGISASAYGLFGAAGASTNSYESIQTYTLGSSQASVTFSSIPSTYKHLQIRVLAREATGGDNSAGDQCKINFNSDTGSNYSIHRLWGDGSSVLADGYASQSNALANGVAGSASTANVFSGGIIDVLDYSSSSKNKTVRSLMGADLNGSGSIWMTSSAWYNTAAITNITLTSSYTFAANSQFALYGIKG